MEALTIFKQAGLSELLNGVKDEWSNGHYLKPIAIGAGLGGLGYSGSALLEGNKDEKGMDKTKRVLKQLLKGTALGGAAGGAYGGIESLMSSQNNKSEDSKPNTPAHKAEPSQSPKGETSTNPPESKVEALKSWKALQNTIKENPGTSAVASPLAVGAIGTSVGGGAGAGVGAIADKLKIPAPSHTTNPDYITGKTVLDYTKPDGLVSRALQDALKEGKTIQSPVLDPNGVPHSKAVPIKLDDVMRRLNPNNLPVNAAGEIIGQTQRLMHANPNSFQVPGETDLLEAGARFGHPFDPANRNSALLNAISQGRAATSHTELPSIKAMQDMEYSAGKSLARRWGGKSAAGGGILGILSGLGINIASQTAMPEEPVQVPANAGASGITRK